MSTITLAPAARTAPRAASRTATRVPARRPAPRGGVRLTRRGRLVVVALALAVVAAVVVAFASGSAATDAASGPAQVRVVTVAPGDTLWALAGEAADELGTGVDEAMQRIEELNTIDRGVVYAGQQLRVPTR